MNPNPSPNTRFQKGNKARLGQHRKDGVLAHSKKRIQKPNGDPGKTHAEAVVEAAFRKAEAGDSKVLPYLLDRIFGKVTQPLEVTGLEDLSARIAAARQRTQPQPAQPERPATIEQPTEPAPAPRVN